MVDNDRIQTIDLTEAAYKRVLTSTTHQTQQLYGKK